MAQKLYTAILLNTPEQEQETVLRDIDLFDLPYDRMSRETPLLIWDDVDMGKSKSGQWPDLSLVGINGAFDCSNFTITHDTVLPACFKKLICKYSINDLGVLIDKLPDAQEYKYTVVVRRALLNNVKNNKDDALDIARRFVDAYPGIEVTDGEQTLAKILQEINAPSVRVGTVTPTTITVETTIPLQTADYLSIKDLVPMCSDALDSEILQNIPKDMERYIKQGLKNVKTLEMRRADDGIAVRCVHRDDVDAIVGQVQELILADIAKSSKPKSAKKIAVKPITDKPDVPLQPGKRKYVHNGQEITVVRIKKYIPRTIWGNISKKYQPNVLLEILQAIQGINVNQSTVVRRQSKKNMAVFIKDGEVRTSSTVEFKHNKCLTQSDGDNMQSRVRIVWGVSGNNFICAGICENHDKGKGKTEYNNLIRNMDIDVSKLDLKSDFLLVSDLIKELAVEKEALATSVSVDVCPVSEQPHVSETVATMASESSAEKSAQTGTRKKYVAPTITVKYMVQPGTPGGGSKPVVAASSDVPQSTDVVDAELPMEQVSESKKETFVPEKNLNSAPKGKREYHWASLYHLKGRLIAQKYKLTSQQLELLQALSASSDTEQMLQITRELQNVLEQKKTVESAIKEVEQKNQELHDFIQRIDMLVR